MKNKEALIVVDYQKWFSDKEVDELYVEWGETIAPIINDVIRETKSKWWIIIATKDMHREWNVSFAQNFIWKFPITESLKKWEEPVPQNFITLEEVQNWTDENNWLNDSSWFTVEELKAYLFSLPEKYIALWPNHCVVNTTWSEYDKGLDTNSIDLEIYKWYKNSEHPYSAAPWIEVWTTRWLIQVLKDEAIKKVKLVWLAEEWCVWDTGKDIFNDLWIDVELIRKATKAVLPENQVEYLKEMRKNWITINEG